MLPPPGHMYSILIISGLFYPPTLRLLASPATLGVGSVRSRVPISQVRKQVE